MNNTNDPQKKYRLGPVSKNILLEIKTTIDEYQSVVRNIRKEKVVLARVGLGHARVTRSYLLLLPSAESFKKDCYSYKRKYVHEVLVKCLFKLAQEKKCG